MLRAAGSGPVRLLVGSFAALIAAGTALLLLPQATPAGAPLGAVDALFTATSATCVTGLVVRDTGTQFTRFGQGVILGLMQLGGLGVMTFSLLVFVVVRGRLSLVNRSLVEQTLAGAGATADLRQLLRHVVVFTFTSEAIGAALLYPRFRHALPPGEALWASVFHAVSAFCNAGFSLWPDSLTRFRGDPWVNVVVMALVILGGLGFVVVYDLTLYPWRRRLSLHSKLTLTVSGALVVVGAAAVFGLERSRLLAPLPLGEQLMASLFQSVAARTAGFNTVETGHLAPTTLLLLIVLMFVGGAPGSCAGGVKTAAVGVLCVSAWAQLRDRRHANVFGRTLGRQSLRSSIVIVVGGAAGAVVATAALLVLQRPPGTLDEQHAAFLRYAFETVSALGTVGLSTGLTPSFAPAGRLLLSLLMFCGRLGPLTVAASLSRVRGRRDWRYPEEEVMVG